MIFSKSKINGSKRLSGQRSARTAAFTVVELIVVVAIFALIMSVALWNQKALSNNILISNLGYEIALAVRETQAYGIGVRAKSGASLAQDFQGGFGINVDLDNPEQLVVFNDLDDDKIYSNNETFAIYKFQNQSGNKIVAVCAEHPSNTPCIAGGGTSFKEATVVFKRPNPEASFRADYPLGGGTAGVKSGPLYIVINTPGNNNCRVVAVETTGQIHVESATSVSPACVNSN